MHGSTASSSGNEQEKQHLIDIREETQHHVIEIPFRNLSLWPKRCIFRVPGNLRKINEETYTPQLVSIGPFHHNDDTLQEMENLKPFYYEKFKKRLMEKNKYERAETKLMEFKRFIQEKIQEICHCYAGMLKQTLEELEEIMLIDAIFIMELFLRKSNTTKYNKDYILSKPYLSKAVALDLLLLENQVPFSILEELYKYVPALPTSQNSSFLELACWYFADFDPQKGSSEKLKRKSIVQAIHFTDLVRNFYLPIHLNFESTTHCEIMYSATKLFEAGLTFEPISDRCLLDISFQKKFIFPCSSYSKARLRLHPFVVDSATERVLRNLIVLEQWQYPLQPYLCNYFLFLDQLINTDADVDLLVQKKFIKNHLGSNQEVTTLINKLGQEFVVTKYCYAEVVRELNAHHDNVWNHYFATLKHVYFRNRWRASSTLVGVLVLTGTLYNFLRNVYIDIHRNSFVEMDWSAWL